MSIRIAGTGSFLPEKLVTNEDMSKLVDTSDEWITTRSGIKTRHFSQGEPTWYLGYRAAAAALENAHIDPCEIDAIFLSTVTPDYFVPSLSCRIQEKLGAVNAFCIDINCACSGFIYALDMANRYLLDDSIKKILIVSAETLSRITNFEDRSTCVLFGDGASACVVEKGEGLYSSFLKADGTGGHFLCSRALCEDTPFTEPDIKAKYEEYDTLKKQYIYMNGREVYKFAVNALPEAVRKACEKVALPIEDLEWIVPHQANIRIIQTAAAKLHFPMEKVYSNLNRTGNTSSACIGICLDEMHRGGLLKRGQKTALVGFGGGLTYGGIVFEW